MKLFELLLAFLRLGVGEGEPDPNDDPTADKGDTDESDANADLDVNLDDDKSDDKSDERPSKEEFEALAAQAKADKERADRFEREMGELRGQQRPNVDEVTRQEDEKLRDPKATDLEKWQIQANRELRRGRSEAQMALAQAHDVADKTAFSRIAVTNAALYKRYESRVEEELAKMRSKGFNASREAIMDNLIGKDMREGKFAKKKAAEDKETKQPVNRGKLPGARSDVSGKNAMSEHEKRAKRLENVQI